MKKVTFLFRKEEDYNNFKNELLSEKLPPKQAIITETEEGVVMEVIDAEYDNSSLPKDE